MESCHSKESKPSLDNLFADFDHPNPNINKGAFMQMALYWPEESIERLIANLSEKDIKLRRKSVQALGSFGDIALLPLSGLFLKSQDLIVRISCLKALVKIVSLEQYESLPFCLGEVLSLARKDEDPQIILASISIMRQLGKKGLPLLIEASKDKNILRAKASITAIGEIHDPDSLNYLNELLQDKSLDILLLDSVKDSLDSYNKYVEINRDFS